METSKDKKIWLYFLGLLTLALISVSIAVITYPESEMHIIACNVGQGDATLVTYEEIQILIDGGPNQSVLNCLEEHVPYWNREIELVILSHPQLDHFGGLIDVFRAYDVDTFVTSGLDSGSQEWEVLENIVGGSDTEVRYVSNGAVLRLGKIYLDIVYPNQNKTALNNTNNNEKVLGVFTTSEDPNVFSIVAKLSLGEFDALFTGDIDPEISDYLSGLPEIRDIEYIKIPHHGSKNGASEKLLETVSPEIAVIPVGKNSYGHPHKEILDILKKLGIDTFRTDEGKIEIVTDGEKFWMEGK